VTRSLDQELEDLYGLPLEQFTAARNELARRLKQEGKPGADDVRRLAKPTVAVWTINQLARREPLAVRRLLAAGAALRKAQERALHGGAAGGLGQTQREERDAVRTLIGRARDLLGEIGRPATDATLERISRTLAAAAIDDSARATLKAGRLPSELGPAGFDALAGILVPDATPSADAVDAAAERRSRQEAERRRRELRDRVRQLDREAREADRTAGRAEADAGRLRQVADAARNAADEAAAELRKLNAG
jgi:hypothetical protein